MEEMIGWMAGVGPKHSLIRLYLNNRNESLAHAGSSRWQQLKSSFVLFITSLRHSHRQFLPDLQSTRRAMSSTEPLQGSTLIIRRNWAFVGTHRALRILK